MALPDGLTPEEVADYRATIRGSYDSRTRVEVLDNDRRLLGTAPALVIGGQVDGQRIELDPLHTGDEDQQVGISRYAKGITLYDPTYRLALDSGSPAAGALYLDRCIRITKSIRGQLRWYDLPLFTGPISQLYRQGPLVTLEAEGCEAFGMGAAFTNTKSIKGGTKAAAFVELMLRTGETRGWMDVPSSNEKLARTITIARDTRYWDKAFALIASMNRDLFYDGYGRLRTPVRTTKPVITIDDGFKPRVLRGGPLLTEEVQITHSLDGFSNAWWQQGTAANGKNVEATATLPSTHRLNPRAVGRGGEPRNFMGTENSNDQRTAAQAKARAERNLKFASTEMRIELDCRAIWDIDPFDHADLSRNGDLFPFPVNAYSLPVIGGRMTIGYQDRLPSPMVAKIRGASR